MARPAYLNTLVRLLPAQSGFDPRDQSWSDDEADAAPCKVRSALQRGGEARGALIDVEAVLMRDTLVEPTPADPSHRINRV